ncbi:hypothetical protein [Labilibaculum euxinus]|nr:hypothetical protein [Labilibaculum euxinus]
MFVYQIEAEKALLSLHVGGWTHESNRKLSEVGAQKTIDEFGN